MGRWASSAVDHYTRMAPLEAALGNATSTLPRVDREALRRELVELGKGESPFPILRVRKSVPSVLPSIIKHA